MIQLLKIRIDEFRGIRELDLEPDGKSLVVLGPNGSGKSGVVDAVDFALTGDVARLSGEGTGGVSLAKHGPHVHRRDDPAAAKVTLTIRHAVSGQTATLGRSVKTPGQFTLDPETPELLEAVEWAALHPEMILSRREVIKYVNAEPGKRAQEVQALLKLERIDETRRLLKSALAKISAEVKVTGTSVSTTEDGVRRHLDLTELLSEQVSGAVNSHRNTLGLDLLEAVASDSKLAEGVQGAPAGGGYDKLSALRDIDALSGYIAEHTDLSAALGGLTVSLGLLEADPTILDALKNRHLVEVGLPLVTDAVCPLCDQAWQDAGELRAHLEGKLARSEAAATLEERIKSSADKVVEDLQSLRALIQTVQPHAASVGRAGDHAALHDWSNDLAALGANLANLETLRQEASRLETDPLRVPPALAKAIPELRAAVEALPDQSTADDARTALTIAEERWLQLRQARASNAKAVAARATADAVYQAYNVVADNALTKLYETVESIFSDYYRRINADDEAAFSAGLSPSAGKLDLEVDFYGLGMFPPMAYHSEGHQDGMGVCLYLALIDQVLGSDFRLAVMDDVVTSVDTNHRRQFCNLLKEVFPEVQFIITTHDEVWARQMQSSGLIDRQSLARFHGWSVDGGPLYGSVGDSWEQIEADLGRDDVPSAAHKLRRNLEASMADIAEGLNARVAYRPDNSHDLGSLSNAVKGRHGELLKKAASSANSWNNEVDKQRVEALKAARTQAMNAQGVENWAINALVHNNDWATMTKADFEPVVEACKQFVELFTCDTAECGSWIYVSGTYGNEEALRCSCGSLNVNLRQK
jgi:recombinational DNA repair ATPase RecF